MTAYGPTALTPERDPRQDPWPGDVVELYNGARAKVIRLLCWGRIIEVEFSHGIGLKWLWMGGWRRWSKNAMVIHRTNEPSEAGEP